MRVGIAAKIVLITIFLIIISSSFLGWYFVRHQTRELAYDLDRLGKALVAQLAVNSEWGVLAGDKDLRRIASDLMKGQNDIAYIRIEADGLDIEVGSREVKPVKTYSREVFAEMESNFTDAMAVLGNKALREKIGSVEIAISLKPLNSKAARIRNISAAMVLMVIVLVSVSIFLMVKFVIGRQLFALMAGIEKIRGGDLAYQVEVASTDEMGQLASSFNIMARDLALTHVSKEYLDNILHSMFNSLFVLNSRGQISMVNNAAASLLGYKAPEFLNRPINSLFADRSITFDAIKNAANAEGFLLKSSGEEVPVIFSTTVMRDKEGQAQGYVCVAQDITERKKAEEKMKMFTQELEHSNAELEQFAYVASHDLREPLRMVTSYIQLLQRRYQDKHDSDANDFIGFAVDGVARMQNLIDALLMYSRVGRNRIPFVLVDCENILKKVLNNLEVVIREQNAVVTHDPLPAIMADEILLTQLLQNLISNAIKFKSKDVQPLVHICVIEGHDDWTFSVKDNGIGIDLKYKDRIFIIFQRLHTREEYPGTGIGLAVCKKIVEYHGGTIWVDSAPGQGTTFYFTISKRGGLG